MKQEWIARAKRFATYALVGCFDTGMDWVAFTTAHELLHFTPVICQAIGYFVGTVCSYFLNGRITFRDGHIARWRQCLRFVMWNVAKTRPAARAACLRVAFKCTSSDKVT